MFAQTIVNELHDPSRTCILPSKVRRSAKPDRRFPLSDRRTVKANRRVAYPDRRIWKAVGMHRFTADRTVKAEWMVPYADCTTA